MIFLMFYQLESVGTSWTQGYWRGSLMITALNHRASNVRRRNIWRICSSFGKQPQHDSLPRCVRCLPQVPSFLRWSLKWEKIGIVPHWRIWRIWIKNFRTRISRWSIKVQAIQEFLPLSGVGLPSQLPVSTTILRIPPSFYLEHGIRRVLVKGVCVVDVKVTDGMGSCALRGMQYLIPFLSYSLRRSRRRWLPSNWNFGYNCRSNFKRKKKKSLVWGRPLKYIQLHTVSCLTPASPYLLHSQVMAVHGGKTEGDRKKLESHNWEQWGAEGDSNWYECMTLYSSFYYSLSFLLFLLFPLQFWYTTQKLLKKKEIHISDYEDKITRVNRDVETLKKLLEEVNICTSTYTMYLSTSLKSLNTCTCACGLTASLHVWNMNTTCTGIP